jgi:hypoxanthine-guanine phosphoribosyltransferase
MLTNGMIEDRAEKMAYDLKRDYEGESIHLLCILKVYIFDILLVIGSSYILFSINT